jgi:hypothetical protein
MKTQEAALEFPTLAKPQRQLETSIQPLKKPTAIHLSVILKRNDETRFKIFLSFSPSSPAYGTFFRITGRFLNDATSNLKRVSVRIFKIFIEASKNLNLHVFHKKAPKIFKNHQST